MNGIKGYISIRKASDPRFKGQHRDSGRTST